MPKGAAEGKAVCSSLQLPAELGKLCWWVVGLEKPREGADELQHQFPAPCTPLPGLPKPLLPRTQPQPCKPGSSAQFEQTYLKFS